MDIEIYSARLNKWLLGLSAIVIVFGATMGLAFLLAQIAGVVSAEGKDIASYAGFKTFIDVLFIVMVFCSMAIATLLLYNYMLLHQPKMPVAENISPLRGDAIAHEKEIVELLKTVAHPLPGKAKLNRAHTAQFLTAMKELELIDPNLVGKQLMVWVQDVTGYVDGASSAFTQALNAVKTNDPEVARLKEQLAQIVNA
jgi:hypothetical protein